MWCAPLSEITAAANESKPAISKGMLAVTNASNCQMYVPENPSDSGVLGDKGIYLSHAVEWDVHACSTCE
jgi:hypothetical protein